MEQTKARSNIYALLSRILLQELDSEMLNVIRKDEQILEFLPTLKEWKEFNEVSDTKLLEEYFNPDFVNLSILHLIPYETFYTREDQMVETGGANPVTDMYSAYDFMVDFEAARSVSADHIGIEYEFLNKHLLQWAPLYLLNMKYEARTPLYYDAADMALEFILSDNEYLTELVK